MAETTPLGFLKPTGNDLFKNGDNVISANAQKAQELIADLQTRFPPNFDGGAPDTLYISEQLIDGGTV